VDVLDDEREGTLTEIFLARLADGTSRRVRPERFVICAAIVIAGETESAGGPEYEHGAGNSEGQPVRELAEPGIVAGEAENFRRIKWREVGAEAVMVALEGGPSGVDDERSETEEG